MFEFSGINEVNIVIRCLNKPIFTFTALELKGKTVVEGSWLARVHLQKKIKSCIDNVISIRFHCSYVGRAWSSYNSDGKKKCIGH